MHILSAVRRRAKRLGRIAPRTGSPGVPPDPDGRWSMVESLVITLREGVEAALVVGITLAYLRKIGRSDLNRHVFAAVGAATLASFILAAVFQAIGFNPENEYLEGALYA